MQTNQPKKSLNSLGLGVVEGGIEEMGGLRGVRDGGTAQGREQGLTLDPYAGFPWGGFFKLLFDTAVNVSENVPC